jgi:helix-turn-helix resolvase-like protein
MPVRSKSDALLTPQALASLSVPERVLLFCLTSGTDWERAGVTHATPQHLLLRGLIDRASTPARFKLTPLGRANGVKFGRPSKLTPHQRREAIARRDAGNDTLTEIAATFGISHSTISRL